MVALQTLNPESEFTVMKQCSDNGIGVKNAFTRHGIVGRYCPPNSAMHAADCIDVLQAALQSPLPVVTESASAFALATTGCCHPLANGGVVVIAGRPHFRDRELADLESYVLLSIFPSFTSLSPFSSSSHDMTYTTRV